MEDSFLTLCLSRGSAPFPALEIILFTFDLGELTLVSRLICESRVSALSKSPAPRSYLFKETQAEDREGSVNQIVAGDEPSIVNCLEKYQGDCV